MAEPKPTAPIKASTPSKRAKLRESLWPDHDQLVYPRQDGREKGWFQAPRTLPLILLMLDDKMLSAKMDLARTYVGILALNYGEGLVEVDSEDGFAQRAGLKGQRGVRSWRERVRQLEKWGFLKVRSLLGGRIGFVLVLNPDDAVRRLYGECLIGDELWTEYVTLHMHISGEGTETPS